MEEQKCEIKLRLYSEQDIEKIIDLLKPNWTYLQSQQGKQYWEWLYTGYRGGRALVVVADHKGKIVGHYATFPMKMRYGLSSIPGGKSEGSAVDKDYRGNIAERFCPQEKDFWLFGKLIHLLWQEAPAHHISMIWGFPNATSVKPHVRAGYSYIQIKVHSLVMPFDVKSTVDRYYAKAPLRGVVRRAFLSFARGYCRFRMNSKALDRSKATVAEITFKRMSQEDLDDRFERYLKAYHGENNQITTERDSDYIRWRFMENPIVPHTMFASERDGEYTSIVVSNMPEKDGKRTANIIDITARKGFDEDLEGLLCFVASELRAEKTDCIRTWLSDCEQSKRYVRTLKRIGFVKLPTGLFGKKLDLIFKFLDPALNEKFAEDAENWYITMAFTEGTS
jgi:Acetyltransferase (GNAT) domain